MENKVYNGREGAQGRLPVEMRVYDLLDGLGIEYLRADHAPAMTIEDCREVDALLDIEICKNLFLCNAQKSSYYLLMIAGQKAFKTKLLSGQIGSSRLSFAGAEAMERLLGLTPGSVSVLGLMNDSSHSVRLLIDKALLNDEYLGCHPCANTSSLKIKMSDILEKFLPAVGHEPTFVDI